MNPGVIIFSLWLFLLVQGSASLSSGSPSACLINPGHFGTKSNRNTSHPYNISVVMDPLNTKMYTIRIESHEHVGFKGILIEPMQTNKGGHLDGEWVKFDKELFKVEEKTEDCKIRALTHRSRKIKFIAEFIFVFKTDVKKSSVVFKMILVKRFNDYWSEVLAFPS
uniref:Reelin domain-containing protein n=1 Tax=Lepeophtheirus salmonis TaxID=72036 RepID=A0A0K2T1M1_LEPSM